MSILEFNARFYRFNDRYTLLYYLFINFIIANKKRIFVDFQRWHRVKYVLIKEWVLQYISKFENLN